MKKLDKMETLKDKMKIELDLTNVPLDIILLLKKMFIRQQNFDSAIKLREVQRLIIGENKKEIVNNPVSSEREDIDIKHLINQNTK